jgi:isopenicillin N synthase-like dioxygenase
MTGRLWVAAAAVVIVAAAVVAFVAYGHGGTSGTPAQQLEAWASSTSLGSDIGTLQDDGTHVQETLDRHQGTVAVHTVCAAMANDAQTFNDELPSPDTAVTQLLARAYGLEYDAAEACYKAGSTGAKLLAQSARDRSEARRLFGEVVARVSAATHHTVSTTTTTPVGTTSTSFF